MEEGRVRKKYSTKVETEMRDRHLIELLLQGYSYSSLVKTLKEEYEYNSVSHMQKILKGLYKQAQEILIPERLLQNLKQENINRLLLVIDSCIPEIGTNNKSREVMMKAIEALNRLASISEDRVDQEIIFSLHTPSLSTIEGAKVIDTYESKSGVEKIKMITDKTIKQ